MGFSYQNEIMCQPNPFLWLSYDKKQNKAKLV